MLRRHLIRILSVAFAVSCVFSSCGSPVAKKSYRKTVFACDTVMTVTYFDRKDEEAVSEALSKASDFEKIFSRTDKEAELGSFLSGDALETGISDELAELLTFVFDLCVLFPDDFDITLGGISDLYGFSSENPGVPAEEDLTRQCSYAGMDKIHLRPDFDVSIENPSFILSRDNTNLKIDLGAVAKGWIADEMTVFLIENGVSSAILNLGGNVTVIGERPNEDGSFSPYKVGIRNPQSKNPNESICDLSFSNRSLSTSGTYERSFTRDGILYHHILDPETGKPVRNGLASVSVLSPASKTCDLLSTALFVAGEEKTKEFFADTFPAFLASLTEEEKERWLSDYGFSEITVLFIDEENQVRTYDFRF